MACEAVAAEVHAYLDDQLEPDRVGRIQEHLRGCAACTQLYERQRAMNSVIRQHAHYYTAPKHLARSIRSNLRTLAEAERPRRRGAWGWFASGAAFASAATLAVSLSLLQPAPRSVAVEQELVAAHVRSLMANHLTDVASSDQHTVKPWFNGKLDMAPPVTDLVVVALVYRHNQHPINLFVWPGDAAAAATQTVARQGYNLVRWSQGGMSFSAVSDLNPADLQAFQELIARSSPPAS